MVPYCEEENIALTPYSALASGRLSRLPGEGGTKRAQEDAYAKFNHIEGAVGAVDLELTPEEIMYLEEPYVPHPLSGVMAQNKPAAAKEKHVWSTGDQKIGK